MTTHVRSKRLPGKGLEASQLPPSRWDKAAHSILGKTAALWPESKFLMNAAKLIENQANENAQLDDLELKSKFNALRECFRLGRDTKETRYSALAMIGEAVYRTLGLRPFRVQYAAALALARGRIVEMATGEGKTLAVSMAGILHGWSGKGCHIVTANTYLALRDAVSMTPLYEFVGLRAKALHPQMSKKERRSCYEADITYGTSSDVAADYLKDQLVLKGQGNSKEWQVIRVMDEEHSADIVQRPLSRVIIDEADSVLIDGSVTPLIISGPARNCEPQQAYLTASSIASSMRLGADFSIGNVFGEIDVTFIGEKKVKKSWAEDRHCKCGLRRYQELVVQALKAIYFYQRDKHYLVDAQKIVIVDESTGRPMPGRSWRDGMHQAIQAKEDVPVLLPNETHARISFQRFFRLYEKISGITGTAMDARGEFWQIYDLKLAKIPTHRRCERKVIAPSFFVSTEEKWQATLLDIKQRHSVGQPVLVGTWSIKDSEQLSKILSSEGLEHVVLNAKNLPQEAAIVAGAGRRGAITIATNMAGRGTDIKLEESVKALGGLHVIRTDAGDCSRVDKQLFGRCARQGDPGSATSYLSFEDPLPMKFLSALQAPLMIGLLSYIPSFFLRPIGSLTLLYCQRTASSKLHVQRQRLLDADLRLDQNLSFAGKVSI